MTPRLHQELRRLRWEERLTVAAIVARSGVSAGSVSAWTAREHPDPEGRYRETAHDRRAEARLGIGDAASTGSTRQSADVSGSGPVVAPSRPQETRTPRPYEDTPKPLRTVQETLRATDGPAIRGAVASGESSLRTIAVQSRDLIKAGLLSEPDLCRRYNLDTHNARLIVEFVRQGFVDSEQATEADVPPYTANAVPGHVRKPWRGNVLVISDLHEPFALDGALDFCLRVAREYDCRHILNIGDECDQHALSYHESDPDGYSAGHEAHVAVKRLRRWYEAFPETDVLVGNHSALPFRKAFTAGLPRRMLRTYDEIWEAPPGWQWHQSMEVGPVYVEHGHRYGMNAALKEAQTLGQSYVQGHSHTGGGCQWHRTLNAYVFALNVGCLVNQDAYAMRYAAERKKKPTLGCGVILDEGRRAHFIPYLESVTVRAA